MESGVDYMVYIYDRIVEPFETKIRRYGANYTLENRTRMGDQIFYTFSAPDRESLLIVPRFAEQYREVEKFCQRYTFCKKFETCKSHIQREINKYVKVDKVPTKESSTGFMHIINVIYKDIKVEFDYMNNRMTLNPEFEIISNNLFGNGIVVLMNLNMED